jgi:hypothetical protein
MRSSPLQQSPYSRQLETHMHTKKRNKTTQPLRQGQCMVSYNFRNSPSPCPTSHHAYMQQGGFPLSMVFRKKANPIAAGVHWESQSVHHAPDADLGSVAPLLERPHGWHSPVLSPRTHSQPLQPWQPRWAQHQGHRTCLVTRRVWADAVLI